MEPPPEVWALPGQVAQVPALPALLAPQPPAVVARLLEGEAGVATTQAALFRTPGGSEWAQTRHIERCFVTIALASLCIAVFDRCFPLVPVSCV